MTVQEAFKSIFGYLRERKDWAIVLSVITFLLFLSLWRIPKWQVSSYRTNVTDKYYWKLSDNERAQLDRELLKAETDARVTLAQILGGLGLLTGLYLTWRQVKTTEDGKITDRYSKAIELLGSDKLDIRLGGIYALERLAIDSKKDHWTVMEALTAFIREHSHLKTEEPPQGQLFESKDKKPIGADIQAALTVIGRRKWAKLEYGRGRRLNLTSIDLTGAILSGADLSGVDLSGTDLSGADLRGADLSWADLSGGYIYRTNMSGANLSHANLTGADLRGSQLTDADLRNANLNEADLSWAMSWRADLSGANLSGANLSQAALMNTNLRGVLLISANLSKINLTGSNLESVLGLAWEQLNSAVMDEETKLSDFLIQTKQNSENEGPAS